MITARPLLSPAYCQTLLDVGEDAVLELIEEGMLYPVFNICCPSARRKEFRILAASLAYYTATSRPLPADPDQVVSDLLPPDAPVTTVSLRRTLNCSPELVRDLLKCGLFTLSPGERLQRGKAGAAQVNRKSALEFLKGRVI